MRPPAEYRKAIVTGAGAFLLVAAQVQPLVHGTALHWLSLGVALATLVTTYAVRNEGAVRPGAGRAGPAARLVEPSARRPDLTWPGSEPPA